MRFWILLAMLGGALLVALATGEEGTVAGLDTSRFMSFAVAATLLAFIGVAALNAYSGRFGKAARDLAIWGGLALALVLGYSYRDDFHNVAQRISGELMPPGDAVSVGCGRTMTEIAGWCRLSDDERPSIMAVLEARRAQPKPARSV